MTENGNSKRILIINPLPENGEELPIPTGAAAVHQKSISKQTEKSFDGSYEVVVDFINRVKSFPMLYNKGDRKYKNENLKMATWVTIAKEFSTTATECISKWDYLRSKYSRHRKRRLTGRTGQDFEFYEPLSFLNSYIAVRKTNIRGKSISSSTTAVNIPETSHILIKTVEHETTPQVFENHMEQDSDDQGTLSTNDGSFEFKNHGITEFLNTNQQSEEKTSENTAIQDEDRLFGETIGAELKQIRNRKVKMKLKLDIYNLLYKALDS